MTDSLNPSTFNSTSATVLLIGPELLVLEGLLRIIDPHCESVHIVTELNNVTDAVRSNSPALVIVDSRSRDWDCDQIINRLNLCCPSFRTLVLVAACEDIIRTTHNHARVIFRNVDARTLVSEVKRALSVGLSRSNSVPNGTGGDSQEKRSIDLTERQIRILKLLSDGVSIKLIGAALNISPRTVEFHKYRMMRLLGAPTIAALIRLAVESGLIARQMQSGASAPAAALSHSA